MFATILLQEAEPNDELGWLLYLILFLLLLMVIVGWLVSRRAVNRTDIPPDIQIRHQETPDDLTRIEGIGPKVARVLNDAGITTFDALARANPADLERTLDEAGLQMMDPNGWIEQARLAAKGDWAELEKLQNELKGGRRK